MCCELDFIDEKVEELTGYDKMEFDTRRLKWNDLLLSEDYQEFKQGFLKDSTNRVIYPGIPDQEKRRKVVWIQDRGQIICDLDGRVEYISGVFST